MKIRHCLAISVFLHGLVLAWLSARDHEQLIPGRNTGMDVHITDRISQEKPQTGATIRQDERSSSGNAAVAGSSPGQLPRGEPDTVPVPLGEIDLDVFGEEEVPEGLHAVLRIHVGRHGRVDRVETETSNIPAEYQEKIVALFARSRFLPGTRDGKAVDAVIRVEIGSVQ